MLYPARLERERERETFYLFLVLSGGDVSLELSAATSASPLPPSLATQRKNHIVGGKKRTHSQRS